MKKIFTIVAVCLLSATLSNNANALDEGPFRGDYCKGHEEACQEGNALIREGYALEALKWPGEFGSLNLYAVEPIITEIEASLIARETDFKTKYPELLKEAQEDLDKYDRCLDTAQFMTELDKIIEEYTRKAKPVFEEDSPLAVVPSSRDVQCDTTLECEDCPEKQKLFKERENLKALLKFIEEQEDADGCRQE